MRTAWHVIGGMSRVARHVMGSVSCMKDKLVTRKITQEYLLFNIIYTVIIRNAI